MAGKTTFCGGCDKDVPVPAFHHCPGGGSVVGAAVPVTIRASTPRPPARPTQAVQRSTIVQQAIDAAIRARKIPPSRRSVYLAAALDGHDVVAQLEQLTPAPAELAAAWARSDGAEEPRAAREEAFDPEFAGLFPPAGDGVVVDPEFAHLFPASAAAAQRAEEDAYRTLFGRD